MNCKNCSHTAHYNHERFGSHAEIVLVFDGPEEVRERLVLRMSGTDVRRHVCLSHGRLYRSSAYCLKCSQSSGDKIRQGLVAVHSLDFKIKILILLLNSLHVLSGPNNKHCALQCEPRPSILFRFCLAVNNKKKNPTRIGG